MDNNKITTTKISNNIWQFNETNDLVGGPYVDAYLICGSDRALLVDTLQNAADLYRIVREKTDLPIDVVVTHAHPDHVGISTGAFQKAGVGIYLSPKDFPLVEAINLPVEKETIIPLVEGMTFDLGGFWLETIAVPGHTPGSVVLLDRRKQIMFSGDTIGSGHFWMQISEMPLAMFCMGLKRLYHEVKDMTDLKIYPGHRNQSPVQLTSQYVKDTLTITERLVSGAWTGEETEMNFMGRVMKYRHIGYGMMVDYCYDPETLRHPRPNPTDEALKDKFEKKELSDGGNRLTYMFFQPETKPDETYPMVIFLHGAGERGTDGRLALANGGVSFADPVWQKNNPCYIFAPQCPPDMRWTDEAIERLVIKAIQTLPKQYGIDSNRIYLTGLSLGGMGTWQLIGKHPSLFAGAIPICGAGNPEIVKNAKTVPVWAFHAADDPVVQVSGKLQNPVYAHLYGTRTMVTALRNTGNTEVHYTEYPAGRLSKSGLHPHFSWVHAYADTAAKEWLFRQNRTCQYEVELLQQGVWFINDCYGSSFYLLEGSERALLIDTGMGGGNMPELVRSLTKLPITLAVTHAHFDHMYHANKFGKFYMSHKDMELLPRFHDMAGSDCTVRTDDIINIVEGDPIDLGGITIDVIEINGHTPGSVAFLDKARQMIFTGDAIGSGAGVWMQVPNSLPLSVYRDKLKRLNDRLSAPGLENLRFLGGHRWQELGFPKGANYNPLNKALVNDMINLCDMVLNDNVTVDVYPVSVVGAVESESVLTASYASAQLLFKESNRK